MRHFLKQIENEVNNEVEVQSFDKIYEDIGDPLTKSINSEYRFYVFLLIRNFNVSGFIICITKLIKR